MNAEISRLLTQFRQEHIFRYLDVMTESEKQVLLQDIEQIDFSQTAELYGLYQSHRAAGEEKKVFQAAEVIGLPKKAAFSRERKRLITIGEEYLHQGRVAIFLVAGGQGTRLGFDGPKGCFPVSPIQQKTLFQLFAESILGLQRKYGKPLQWYIMTSYENNQATHSFFTRNAFFGLKQDSVHFLIQKEIPSLDAQGKLIISPEKRIFKNPNGHGGAIYALHDSGALQDMAGKGIDELFYFQVDNPLAKIADPLFIGAHVENRAQMSTKVVQKVDPAERVGIIGRVNGKLGCIEYSELSAREAQERTPEGRLRFSSANIAIHMINRGFVEKLTHSADFRLPFHSAVKTIEYLGDDGRTIKKIEGIKFEMFIFDALGFAERSVTFEVPREEEFSPVKNNTGADSPETARNAMINLHTAWLRTSGRVAAIPDNLIVEISPLYALDEDAFREKFNPPPTLVSPLYIE